MHENDVKKCNYCIKFSVKSTYDFGSLAWKLAIDTIYLHELWKEPTNAGVVPHQLKTFRLKFAVFLTAASF